jgi:3-mercaptopyruvate sulfurtransferase SseA
MKMRGFTKVYYLKGGWAEWVAAKYPTEPKDTK